MKKLLCKLFGHKYDAIEKCVFGIEMSAMNREALKPEISCLRCGLTIKGYKD